MTSLRSQSEYSWSRLTAASERLATARSMDAVVAVLRDTAREVVGAEGIAVIVRDDDRCFYAAEDAIGPLWTGRRFPAAECVSGWAMMHGQTVAIPDIRVDSRVPQEAYRATFVRSLIMVPFGMPEAVGAIGAYWSDMRDHDPAIVERLEALARSAAIAVENARLLISVREADRQRALALEAGRMGFWSLDIASGMLTSSAACRASFGRDPAAEFGYRDWQDAIHDDDRERISHAIAHSLASGAPYDVEYRVTTPAGAVRWIGIRAQPAYAPEGRPIAMAGVSIDITARREMEEQLRNFTATLEQRVEERTAELLKTQEALRQSQKLEAMGQLTGGVAHDFNNLLTPIMGSLDMLRRRGVGSEREQRLIGGALESAERAKTLVQRLLAFARRQPLTPTSVDLTTLLIEMGTLIGTTLGPKIALSLDIAADLPTALADQNQIEMAILNLAVNARDAMPDGGRLIVSARPDRVDDGHPLALRPGDYVLVTITDSGIGMDEETRSRAIEPFYSTKGLGKGTGLGLSMVHGLASQLGGGLGLTSCPGIGTAIELWLPVSVQPVVVALAAVPAPVARASGVILLVDDEDLVRASTADMLGDLGFHVLEARSAAEALILFDAHPRIDAIVTDHLMPHMTGAELARTIRHRHPDFGILVASGYSDALDIPADLPRLGKPFRQADLAASLAAILSKGADRPAG